MPNNFDISSTPPEVSSISSDLSSIQPRMSPAQPKVSSTPITVTSPLSGLFYVLAVLSIVGGIALAIQFWPGDIGSATKLNPLSYFYSIILFSAGLVQFALFIAIGKVLSYLKQIMVNTLP